MQIQETLPHCSSLPHSRASTTLTQNHYHSHVTFQSPCLPQPHFFPGHFATILSHVASSSISRHPSLFPARISFTYSPFLVSPKDFPSASYLRPSPSSTSMFWPFLSISRSSGPHCPTEGNYLCLPAGPFFQLCS